MTSVQRGRGFGSALLVLAAGVLLVGCSSAEPGEPSSPVPSTSATTACADAAELKSSVQALTEIEPLQDGLDAVESATADTKADLDSALASATAELRPAVEEVRSAFTDVQTTVNGSTADSLRDKASEIVTALDGLRTALGSLGDTVSQQCPE